MSESKIDERLMRLVSSGLCPHEDPTKYAVELRDLADKVADALMKQRGIAGFSRLWQTQLGLEF